MIDSDFALVDSNVLIDIIRRDPLWADWSLNALSERDQVKVNPIIFAEICYQKTSADEASNLLMTLGIGYEELPRQSLYLAAQAYKVYRLRGGNKTAPLPDFFIGAHAVVQGVPLITRDVSRYQTYFPTVSLICP